MARIRIGLSLSCLKLPLRPALAQTRKLAVTGIELEATGDFSPRNLSQTGRRELRHLAKSFDQQIIALACPLRKGLETAENQQQRIDLIKEVLSLSYDLGARQAVVPFGKLPAKDDEPDAARLREALLALGQYGDRVGAQLLFETGADNGETLAAFLARFDTGSLGVCFNPGALIGGGHDPHGAARALAGFVRHVHAADARQVSPGRMHGVPLGHGDIDWLAMLGTLEEIAYRSWLAISEAQGAVEAEAAVQFLRRLIRPD
jgi:sugar phosphate isomerase/epimerase